MYNYISIWYNSILNYLNICVILGGLESNSIKECMEIKLSNFLSYMFINNEFRINEYESILIGKAKKFLTLAIFK